MMKPLLLLDIDGVLNLFSGHNLAGLPVTRPVKRTSARDFSLSIPMDAPELVAQLSEHFDIHWYTMWNEHAERDFAPVADLPYFPYLQVDWWAGENALRDMHTDPDSWRLWKSVLWVAKTPLIPSHVGSRPFVWVDDDTTEADTMWLAEHPDVSDFLILTVKPWEGLTQETVDQAISWARELSEVST